MEKVKELLSANDIFAKHNGIELLSISAGTATASMQIKPYHYNAAGTVHGGAIFTLADFAFAAASNSHGRIAMGISTSVNFVKAAVKGMLHAEALENSINQKLASYTVTVTDDDNSTIAIFQGMVYRKQESILKCR